MAPVDRNKHDKIIGSDVPTVLINNPLSRKNKRVYDAFPSQARAYLRENFLEPRTRPELFKLITDLHRQNVRRIAISGGDGTISDVMTALHHVYGDDDLPGLAIFPSGNSNLIARDVGFKRRSRDGLQRLLDDPTTLREQSRGTLKLRWVDGVSHERIGMFHGTTGFTRAIAIAHSPKLLKWAPHNLAVAATLVATLWRLRQRRHRDTWLAGDVLQLTSDGAPLSHAPSFIFLATALEKLSMGMWPFWTDENDVEKRGVHYLNVDGYPGHLLQAVSLLMRGKTAPWLTRHPSYRSGNAMALELTGPETFVLDGETFHTGPSKRVELTAGPQFRFYHD